MAAVTDRLRRGLVVVVVVVLLLALALGCASTLLWRRPIAFALCRRLLLLLLLFR